MARPPGKAGFAAGTAGTVMRRPVGSGMPRSPAGAATDAASGTATCAAAITVAIAAGGPRARR